MNLSRRHFLHWSAAAAALAAAPAMHGSVSCGGAWSLAGHLPTISLCREQAWLHGCLHTRAWANSNARLELLPQGAWRLAVGEDLVELEIHDFEVGYAWERIQAAFGPAGLEEIMADMAMAPVRQGSWPPDWPVDSTLGPA